MMSQTLGCSKNNPGLSCGFHREGEAPAEPQKNRLGRSLALPIKTGIIWALFCALTMTFGLFARPVQAQENDRNSQLNDQQL